MIGAPLASHDSCEALVRFAESHRVMDPELLRFLLCRPDPRWGVKGRSGGLKPWIADGRLVPGQCIHLRDCVGKVCGDGNLFVLGVGLFGSLSAAAEAILGYVCRGPAQWRTESGALLMDL